MAAGYAIGTAIAWRYVRESVDLLADDLWAAMIRASRLAYAILDGTLIALARLAAQKPDHAGKHRRHGVNCRSSPIRPAVRCGFALPAR